MKLKEISMLSCVLLLAACSQGGSGGDGTGMPEKLEFQTQVGAHISDDEFLKAAQVFKSLAGSMPSKFLFDLDSDREKNKIEMGKLEPAYQKLLSRMNSLCQIQKPKSEASKDSNENHRISIEKSEISGAQCPLSFQRNNKTETFVMNLDKITGAGLFQIHSTSTENEEMLTPQLQNLSKVKNSQSSSETEGRFKVDPSSPQLYVKAKMKGTVVPVESEISKFNMEASMEILEKRISADGDFIQLVVQAKILGGPKEILVSAKVEAVGQNLLIQVFINGRQMSKELSLNLIKSGIISTTEEIKPKDDGTLVMKAKGLSAMLDQFQTKKTK